MELALKYWGARAARCRFLGLRTEFPIIICSLAAGTDAIIGTDVLGSVLPHTLDIKNGLLFTQGGASLQLHRRVQPCQVACSRWAIRQYRHIRRLSYTAPSGPLVVAHCHLVACWRTDAVCGGHGPPSWEEPWSTLWMEGSCPGVKFRPGNRRGEPLHGGGDDCPGDRHTVSDGR